MPVQPQHIRARSTVPHAPNPPHPPHQPEVSHVPLEKHEQEVRRRHDTPPPKHHDPEEEGVLGETDRPKPPSEKPQ